MAQMHMMQQAALQQQQHQQAAMMHAMSMPAMGGAGGGGGGMMRAPSMMAMTRPTAAPPGARPPSTINTLARFARNDADIRLDSSGRPHVAGAMMASKGTTLSAAMGIRGAGTGLTRGASLMNLMGGPGP
jgi:hypothetical protein